MLLGAALTVGVLDIGEHRLSRAVAAEGGTKVPMFEVDPSWPKLPNGWAMGHVTSVAVDRHNHVWLLQRPNTVPAAQKEHAAPPVLEFDNDGKFVQAWGGPDQGFDWPDSEHGITVDYKDNVWIGGSSPFSFSLTKRADDMLLKFNNKGKFLLQIGGRDAANGAKDTKSVHEAADVFIYPKTNEAFVADGYGNRRVIVFDADTGAFKRQWGAFGNEPTDRQPIKNGAPINPPAPAAAGRGRGAPPTDVEGPGPQQFGVGTSGPVHGIKVSHDGIVYVADRGNRRIQLFTPEGKYLKQMFLNRTGPSDSSAASVAFSPDKDQQFLYAGDYGNSHIAVIDRKKLEVLYQFGMRSPKPGDFQGLHMLAVDMKGNIYTGEVAPGARAQRFLFRGMSAALPPNALTPEQLAAKPTTQ
jgi:DNA-binding beta-propeller fold protein YncE